ncbi:MAG: phosphate ABC transporter substrate-binding protein, partial [Gammaproteobacteria bacterium]
RAGGLLLALCLLAFWRPALAESVLVVPGTGDAIAILRALASDFNALHRGDMRVDVPDSVGSSGGIRAVMRGEAELARTARPLKPQEKGAGLRAEPWATYPVVF